ncbi:hypothetical protein [Streptomyces hirsutus]|uniref:hypothetical protein n=1 Tax=Streptomyces hirsutus TaxID=35620 RepID=UPI00367B3903
MVFADLFAEEVERSPRVLSGASGGSADLRIARVRADRDAHPDRAVAGEIAAVTRAEVRPRGIHRARARGLGAAHGGPPKSRPQPRRRSRPTPKIST